MEFIENVKIDLFPDEVYVFTPKGKIVELPTGATPVDFAYAVHTDVGNSCVGTKINGRIMPLVTQLQNGHALPGNPVDRRLMVAGAQHGKQQPRRCHGEAVAFGYTVLSKAGAER